MEVHLPRARDEALGELAETHGVRRAGGWGWEKIWEKYGAYPKKGTREGYFSEHDDEAMDLVNGFSDKPKWSIERVIMMNHDEAMELGTVAYFAD